jgi:hypothetical protein
MNLDIKTAVQTAFILAIAGTVLSFLIGYRSIRAGRKLFFFHKRHDLISRGWRFIFFSVGLGVLAFLTNGYAEPIAYKVFPPSPTVIRVPSRQSGGRTER